jgi:hypothetical protein
MEWAIGFGLFVVLTLAAEISFRMARRRSQDSEATKGQTGAVQGAVLGLMGLLAGFTMAMAVGRFDVRRQLITEEANAIGTCYLRTSLLPRPHSETSERLVREYLDERIHFSELLTYGPQLDQSIQRARDLQTQLWREAVAASEVAPAVPTGLYIQSLNQLIDVEGVRMRAVENHVPVAILVLLVVSAVASVVLMGYVYGQAGQRNLFAMLTATALFSLVLTIIIDLDRPRVGLVQLSHASLLELRDSLGPRPTE